MPSIDQSKTLLQGRQQQARLNDTHLGGPTSANTKRLQIRSHLDAARWRLTVSAPTATEPSFPPLLRRTLARSFESIYLFALATQETCRTFNHYQLLLPSRLRVHLRSETRTLHSVQPLLPLLRMHLRLVDSGLLRLRLRSVHLQHLLLLLLEASAHRLLP